MADTGDDASGFHVVSPDGPLYRIARVPDPWAWPDWAHVGIDGTFGNRWDDPQSLYRVVYASSSRLGDEFRNWAIYESSNTATH